MSLANQRVVVIGGTSGIGFATAKAAAADGASVVVASSSADRVTAATSRLPAGCEGRVLDVNDELRVGTFFEELGEIDHVVYTAGRLPSLDASGPGAQSSVLEAIAKPLGARQTVGRHAGEHVRPGGSITFTSGLVGTRPQKGMVTVAGLASAVEGLARALAVELAPVRVNTVRPGIIRTELWEIMAPDQLAALFDRLGASLLTGRVGEPEDVAEAYLFLMRSAFVTGTVVAVDGGGQLV